MGRSAAQHLITDSKVCKVSKAPKNIKNVITHNRSMLLKNKNEKELSVEKLASEKIIE